MPQVQVGDPSQYPWDCVVHISAVFPDGKTTSGSGVMVGPNDVLTAAHMVYKPEHGGAAERVWVTLAFNPSPLATPFGTVEAATLHYFTDWSTKAGGIPIGNFGPGFTGIEHDVAVLDLNVALGKTTGWMGLDPNFQSGKVNVTGYPGKYDHHMMNDYGEIKKDALDDFFVSSSPETGPGNSGGPAWYLNSNGDPFVVGLLSGGTSDGKDFYYAVSAEYNTVRA